MAFDTSDLTRPVPPAAQPISVIFPGGVRISGQLPSTSPATKLENAAMLLGRATAGMGPLSPIFDLIGAMLAVKDFAEAVPSLLTDPSALVEATSKLVTKISRLARLIPQLSLPLLILGLVDALLCLLEGLVEEMAALVAQVERIDAAEASVVLAPALAPVIVAARADVVTQMGNLQVTLGEADAIVGVINALGQLIGLEPIPTGTSVGSDPSAAVEALGSLVDAIRAVRATIPA